MKGEYAPSAVDWVREQVERIEETGTTEGVLVKDRPIVLMTYRGAKSGKVRKTPVMRAAWWERAVDAYPDYADYQQKTDREIPVLELEPTDA